MVGAAIRHQRNVAFTYKYVRGLTMAVALTMNSVGLHSNQGWPRQRPWPRGIHRQPSPLKNRLGGPEVKKGIRKEKIPKVLGLEDERSTGLTGRQGLMLPPRENPRKPCCRFSSSVVGHPGTTPAPGSPRQRQPASWARAWGLYSAARRHPRPGQSKAVLWSEPWPLLQTTCLIHAQADAGCSSPTPHLPRRPTARLT